MDRYSIHCLHSCNDVVWCGLSDGTVCILNDSSVIEYELRVRDGDVAVSCMLSVSGRVLWVGYDDGYVVVINARLMNVMETLDNFHTDGICHMAYDKKHRTVWTISKNGQLIAWDDKRNAKLDELVLPSSQVTSSGSQSKLLICLCDDEMWVVSKKSIMIFDRETHKTRPSIETDERLWPTAILSCSGSVWISYANLGILHVYDQAQKTIVRKWNLDCGGILNMLVVNNMVWTTTEAGPLYLFDIRDQSLVRDLHGHQGASRALCTASHSEVVVSASSETAPEPRIFVWLKL